MLGKVLGLTYAACAIPQMLLFTQVNQAYSQFSAVTGVEAPWTFGLLLSATVALVIIGGIRSIASVTSRLVPLMCIIYLLAATTILVLNASAIPDALVAIVVGAFAPGGRCGRCHRRIRGRNAPGGVLDGGGDRRFDHGACCRKDP
jgi:AGCS family alanine or glycine:cation symporter